MAGYQALATTPYPLDRLTAMMAAGTSGGESRMGRLAIAVFVALALTGGPATGADVVLHCQAESGAAWYTDSDTPLSRRPAALSATTSLVVGAKYVRFVSREMQRDFRVLRRDRGMVVAESPGVPTREHETAVARLTIYVDVKLKTMALASMWMRHFGDDDTREMQVNVNAYVCQS